MIIKCIAIDDEPLALKQIQNYIGKTPFLKSIGGFDNALSALQFVQENDVALMFVDINLPDLSGMDFVKTLKNPPRIIFTTAYSEYAVEGYKVDALDYLLKPISYSDFLRAAGKARDWYVSQDNKDTDSIKKDDNFLLIKSEHKILRINFSAIKYIEGMREYVRIHLANQKPVMTLLSMKKMEETLPLDQFMRVHRSYIVNLNQINTIERSRIIFDEKVYIPVSEQYKEKFQAFLDKNFLF